MAKRHRELLAEEPKDECTSFPASDQQILDRCGFTVDINNQLGEGVYAAICNTRSVRYWNSGERLLWRTFEGRAAAVKHIHIDRRDRDMNRRELIIIGQLRHPNIVEVFDIFVIRVRAYIVMEYCPDGTLQDFYYDCLGKRQTLTEPVFHSFVKQITDALLYLHGVSVSHGDLKMRNIMVFKRSNYNDIHNANRILLKVIDFGFSNFLIGKDSNDLVQTDLIDLGEIVAQLVSVVHDMDVFAKMLIDIAAEEMVGREFRTLSDAIGRYEFLNREEYARLNAGQTVGSRGGQQLPNWVKRDDSIEPNIWRRNEFFGYEFADGREYSAAYERLDIKRMRLKSI